MFDEDSIRDLRAEVLRPLSGGSLTGGELPLQSTNKKKASLCLVKACLFFYFAIYGLL